MGLQPIEVEGTLHSDGTLVLDEKPNVPPGRVRVALSPVAGATPPEDGFMARMQKIGRNKRPADTWAGRARRSTPRSTPCVTRRRRRCEKPSNCMKNVSRASDQHERDQGSGR